MGNNPSGSYQTMVTIYSEEEVKTKLEKESLWELKETTNYTWKKAKIDIHAKKRLKVLVPNVEKHCVFPFKTIIKIPLHVHIRKETLVQNVEKHEVF